MGNVVSTIEARRTSGRRTLRHAAVLLVLTAIGLPAASARAEDQAAMITQPARDAIQAMGKALSAGQFSFRTSTIREYADENGQPLHIFHDGTVMVHRPNQVRADVTGDDGTTRIAYDGANLAVLAVDLKKYASIPLTGDIEQMMKVAQDRLGLDFPLADFIAGSADKAFLAGITSGYEVNTVMVNGKPCSHLLFSQPPGIELELWLEKGEPAVPRRLIVTYRALPGEPRFIAEMSDWNFTAQPAADAFTLRLPDGVARVDLAKEEVK